jgi:putative ABC transport system permease protein
MLLHDRPRLLTSIGGVAFAVLLMLVQMGFRNSLVDSATALVARLDADVIIAHADKDHAMERDPIPRVRLAQALSTPGVAAAHPLWFDERYFVNPLDATERPIRVIGVRPGDPVFTDAGLQRAAAALREPDTALADRRSRDYYGPLAPGPAQIGRRVFRIVGDFELGADLEEAGNLLVGEETYFRLARTPPDRIEMALVKVAPRESPARVAEALNALLPGDVVALTKAELLRRDAAYWDTGTPVSVVVAIGMLMGFVVGTVICYQILYTEVTDHLPQFATLRAIGFSRGYLAAVVLSEALLLALVAFLPSLGAGALLYAALAELSGLLLELTPGRVGFVLALTLGMCAAAGFLALRRVLQADPAELF